MAFQFFFAVVSIGLGLGFQSPAQAKVGDQIFDEHGRLVATVIWELDQKIGSGGFGTVHRARIQKPDGQVQEVAIKTLKDSGESSGLTAKTVSESQQWVRQVTHHSTSAGSSPSSHLRAQWSGLKMGSPGQPAAHVVLMDYMQGSTQNTPHSFLLLPTTGGNPANSVRNLHQLMLDSSHGLDELFRAGLTHGDIKPHNILFKELPDGSRRFFISDLDGVRPANRDWAIFTPMLVSPEHYTREGLPSSLKTSAASDVYALATSVYERAFGAYPMEDYALNDPQQRKRAEAIIQNWIRSHPQAAEVLAPVMRNEPGGPRVDLQSLYNYRHKDPLVALSAQSLREELTFGLASDPRAYERFLRFVEARFDTALLGLPEGSQEAQKLREIQSFARHGLARHPESRINAMWLTRRLRPNASVAPVSCPSRLAHLAARFAPLFGAR